MDRDEIGKRIATAREALGMNQSDLARAMGVKPQSVQSWEAGRNTPRPPRVSQLSSILGVSIGYLMGEDTEHDAHRLHAAPAVSEPQGNYHPDGLARALLAAAEELNPLQVADLIAYARQLSGTQIPPARTPMEPNHLDEPITANMPDEPEGHHGHEKAPPGGPERQAKN